jgi:hypothetical protein
MCLKGRQNFQELQGGTWVLPFSLTDDTGNPIDLTPVTFSAHISSMLSQPFPDAIFTITKSITPADGTITLTMPKTTTSNLFAGKYYYVVLGNIAGVVVEYLQGEIQVIASTGICHYELSENLVYVSADGVSSSVYVETASDCAWVAISNNAWIKNVLPVSPTIGVGIVTFNIDPNTGIKRTGTMTIAGKTFIAQQDTCVDFSFVPKIITISSTENQNKQLWRNMDIGQTGGTFSFLVITEVGATWIASSAQPWITAITPSSGTGSTTISFTVAANPGEQRFGFIKVGDKNFTILQATG